MSNDDNKSPDGLVYFGGRAARLPNLEINSYMRTPIIRPVPTSTQQTTSQNQPAVPEKK